MWRLLFLLLLSPVLGVGAVIKTDLFDEASDTELGIHTSDSGGGWQGSSTSLNVLGATDDVQDIISSTVSMIGDEDPTETDYFMECNFTMGGATSTDRVGVLARSDGGATHTSGSSSYYKFRMLGDSGWSLWRVEAGVPDQTGLNGTIANASYISSAGIGTGDIVKMKMQVEGTGATVTFTLSIDPDELGYDVVSSGTTDTDANRIVTAGNVGIIMRQTVARIKDCNAEDLLSGGATLQRRRRTQQ